MYTHCLFCNADLGRNEAIEAFPVGRRLAYDAAKGRLWVVCGACGRWNLTPLEERWEAIEQAERLYRGTRLRASTDNVGLARVANGLDLVRIGRPNRPEFAHWRYAPLVRWRRARHLAGAGVVTVVAGTVLAGGVWIALPLLVLASWPIGWVFDHGQRAYENRVLFRTPAPDAMAVVRRRDIRRTTLLEKQGSEVRLRLAHTDGTVELGGDHALRVVARLLPLVNGFVGSPDEIAHAAARVQDRGGPQQLITDVARRGPRLIAAAEAGQSNELPSLISLAEGQSTRVSGIAALPPTLRLALEMSVHEIGEQLATHGEVVELERAWRDAEEIAAIADGLVLPRSVEEAWTRLRARVSPSEPRVPS